MKQNYSQMRNRMIALGFSVVLLSSCASTIEEDVARYETYDCLSLAKEIGKYEEKLKVAKDQELDAELEQIFTDNDEEAEWDEAFAEWDADDARVHLDRIKQIYYKKQCG